MKIKKDSRQKLQGTVLFTVVAVMMVVLVFVMSALTIAGATSRRAYSDYAKSQAQYSARSAIDATITYLQDSDEFAKKVKTLNSASDSFDVTVSYESADGSTDDVTVTVKLVAKDFEYTDGKHDVVSLTASSSLLDESSDVSLFLLKDSPGTSVGGFSNALTTLGSFNADGAGKITSYGGSSLNLDVNGELPEDAVLSINENNGATYRGNMLYNSSVEFGTASVYNYILSKNIYGVPDGIVCYGDLVTEKGINITSEVNYTGEINVKYNEIPYVFVEGTLNLSGKSMNANSYIGNSNSGLNIFCNQFISASQNNQEVYADAYIWGTDDNYFSRIDKFKEYPAYAIDYYNHIDIEGRDKNYPIIDSVPSAFERLDYPAGGYLSKIGNNKGTQLLSWADSIVNDETHKVYGGNIFSKGSLSFNGSSVINGDVTAEQGVYLCEYNGVTKIDGKLVVGGVLLVNNNNNYSEVSQLYISSPDNVIINGTNGGIKIGDKIYKTTDEFKNACSIADPADPNYNPDIIIDESKTKDTFPDKMTKDEVVGFISNKETAITQHKDPTTGDYNAMMHRTDFAAAEAITYKTPQNGRIERIDATGTTSFGNNTTITESCILSGNIMGATITFDASSGSTLYVILDNVNITQNSNFYINSNGGNVYFFCDTSCNLDNAKIITTNYKDAIESGAPIDILETPGDLTLLAQQHIKNCESCQVPGWEDSSSSAYAQSIENAKNHIADYHIKYNSDGCGCDDITDVQNHLKNAVKWMPNVYFYMDKRADGTNSTLDIKNSESMITAYVYAPYTEISMSNTKNLNNVTYNGKPVPSGTCFSIIGSTTAKVVTPGPNEEAFFFIDPSGASSGITDADGGTWFPMYYQNSSDVE